MEAGAGVGEAAGERPPGPPGLLGQLLLLLLLPEPQLANWLWRRASAGEGEDGSGDRMVLDGGDHKLQGGSDKVFKGRIKKTKVCLRTLSLKSLLCSASEPNLSVRCRRLSSFEEKKLQLEASSVFYPVEFVNC